MPKTRWLSPAEQRVWRSFLVVNRLLFEQLDHDLQEESGLSHNDYELLVHLSEAKGHRMRMSELADSAQSSRSRLSHAVTRLEDAGWVRRESCATDRRGQEAVLTDEGYAVLKAAAPGHVESVRRHLFDNLSEAEVGQLGRIAAEVVEHLESLGLRCPGLDPLGTAPAAGR
jgi:DNA-binding MarR family transcriptional regulator